MCVSSARTDVVSFGYKDHSVEGNGLDASDDDDAINIRTWPVFGMYEPAQAAVYRAFGETYLVTPTEGDPRNKDAFSERARVRDLVLDPTAFPDVADLQLNANLGRLRVTNVQGDRDGDGSIRCVSPADESR